MLTKNRVNNKGFGKCVLMAAATLLLCVLISGISFAAGTARVKKLTVSSKSVTVAKGSSITIKAVVTASRAASANKLRIKAVSSDRKIASVKIVKKPSATGKKGTSEIRITGKEAGTCEIRITTSGKNKKGKRLTKVIRLKVKKSGSSSSKSPSESNTPAKRTNDISDITLADGQPGSNLTATYLFGGAGAKYFFTMKVGEYSGDLTLKLEVGSKTDERTFSVSKNTTYKLTCTLGFTGYQDQKLPGAMPGQYTTIPATYNRFTMSFTMPDGTVKTFSKREKGSVSSVGIGALEAE